MTAVAIATFDDKGAFVRARLRAVTDERRVLGEWAPYASGSMAGNHRAILIAALIGGVLTGLGLFTLQSWTAVLAYPIDSGGRALWSWQTLLPSAIEVAAPGAAVAGIIAFFVRARLTRLYDAAFDFDEVARASEGSFVLALACDPGDDANAALALLATAGATHSRVIAP